MFYLYKFIFIFYPPDLLKLLQSTASTVSLYVQYKGGIIGYTLMISTSITSMKYSNNYCSNKYCSTVVTQDLEVAALATFFILFKFNANYLGKSVPREYEIKSKKL